MPYIPSATMARQRVYLQGQPEFDEHIRRLNSASPEAKRAVLEGGAQEPTSVSGPDASWQTPAPGSTARINQLTGGEYSNPNVAADPRVVAQRNDTAAVTNSLPGLTAGADAAEADLARTNAIIAAPNEQQIRESARASAMSGGRTARENIDATAAGLNQSKANDAAMMALPAPEMAVNTEGVRGGWQPETAKSLAETKAVKELMSQGMTFEQAREQVNNLAASGQLGGIVKTGEGPGYTAGGTWVDRGAVGVRPVDPAAVASRQADIAGEMGPMLPNGFPASPARGTPRAEVFQKGPDEATQAKLAEGPQNRLATAKADVMMQKARGDTAQAHAAITQTLADTIRALPPEQRAVLIGAARARDPQAEATAMLAVASQVADPVAQKALIDAVFLTMGMQPVYEETPEGTIEFLSRQLQRLFSGGAAGTPPRKVVGYGTAKR
jgi:hypothetical protein